MERDLRITWLALINGLRADHARALLNHEHERANMIYDAYGEIVEAGESLGWNYTETMLELLYRMGERSEG